MENTKSKKSWLNWVLFIGTLVVVFILGLFASSIMERRTEAVFVNKPKVKIGDFEPRNAVWGENYKDEYETYLQTSDTGFRSKYNGSATIDMLEVDPRMVVLWAGYAFSKDYKQARGHYYAIDDIRNILRTGSPMKPEAGPQHGTCWTCKSPDVPRIMNSQGIDTFYNKMWGYWGSEIVNPIGCADCHNPKTQNLTITRPALIEAFKRQGKDITKATRQEMRSLVCAQCHVEYYFKKDPYSVVFPWDNGITVEEIEKYYDNLKFSDWTHALSKTPMLKAQHPDYEIFTLGIHAQRGVSCADCHMPYMSKGGQKFTNHHIQSPLANVNATCQVCHRESEQTLIQNVYDRQDKVIEIRNRLEEILVKAHIEAKTAWDAGATEQEMAPVLQLIRQAQWRWDFAAAGHGSSFHAPVEVARIIGNGIDKAQEARIQLAVILKKYNVSEVKIPDISTKAKAQEYIGLDMNKLKIEKADFLKTIVPVWIENGKARESKWLIVPWDCN